MAKENNVNIELEVCRDANSGKLTIMAHFDMKASNVFIDGNECIWMPTIEEKDLAPPVSTTGYAAFLDMAMEAKTVITV
jgi:hypothetical protein